MVLLFIGTWVTCRSQVTWRSQVTCRSQVTQRSHVTCRSQVTCRGQVTLSRGQVVVAETQRADLFALCDSLSLTYIN